MLINGYEVNRAGNLISVREVASEKTKSWEAMERFCERFPLGTEPEWDRFVIRHTAMQRREIDDVLRTFAQSSSTKIKPGK